MFAGYTQNKITSRSQSRVPVTLKLRRLGDESLQEFFVRQRERRRSLGRAGGATPPSGRGGILGGRAADAHPQARLPGGRDRVGVSAAVPVQNGFLMKQNIKVRL